MESDDILYICITCKKNGEAVEPRPGKILYDNLKRLNSKMNIKPVKCLAGCSNGDGKIRFSERPAAFKKQSLARVPPENYMVVEDE